MGIGYHYAWTSSWAFGLEVGYKQLVDNKTKVYGIDDEEIGRVVVPRREMKSSAWDALVVAKYVLCDGWTLFGKLGGAEVRTHVTQNELVVAYDPSLPQEGALGKTAYTLVNIYPEACLGVGYMITKNFGLTISYSKIFAEKQQPNFALTEYDQRPFACPSFDIFALQVEIYFP